MVITGSPDEVEVAPDKIYVFERPPADLKPVAGIATVTDLISTSPDSLATIASIDPKMAQDIHLSVQKKIWFGGIE